MHHKVVAVIQKILHILEFVISVLTLVFLVAMIGMEVYRMCTVPGEYFVSLDTYLHVPPLHLLLRLSLPP